MELSQSAFLQSLGWATLNSFWQFGLLWCVFLLVNQLFRLSSHKKYILAVSAIGSGFAWFLITFIFFYSNGKAENFALVEWKINDTNETLDIVLSAASIAYLSLLSIPTYKLIQNWRYVFRLKKTGLQKSAYTYRLFVKRIGQHLGIKKPVQLYLSELVQSPLTIGFFKPMILLPVAALNSLTTQQVEAILLHELSHIRRYDYLVNILVAVINTVLYFNPFVKRFMKAIEAERENCCDEMVLQFEYDKLSYASALLALEKQAAQHQLLAIAANGKNSLLHRIERIVGMQKKPTFNITHFVGVFASLILIMVINSFIISGKDRLNLQMDSFSAPFALFSSDQYIPAAQDNLVKERHNTPLVASAQTSKQRLSLARSSSDAPVTPAEQPAADETLPDQSYSFTNVGYDEVENSLTAEQKEKVKATVETTKKALKSEWHQVEKTIPDGLTEQEKQMAQQEYNANLDKMDWKNVEQGLKAQINTVDLDRINENLNAVIVKAKIDSVQAAYTKILSELNKTEASRCTALPMPDASKKQVQKARVELENKIQLLEAIKTRKVVKI